MKKNNKYIVTNEKNIEFLYKKFKNKEELPGAVGEEFIKKKGKREKNKVIIQFNEEDFFIVKNGEKYTFDEWQKEKNAVYLLFDEEGLEKLNDDIEWLRDEFLKSEDYEKVYYSYNENEEYDENEIENGIKDEKLIGIKIEEIKKYAQEKTDLKNKKGYLFKIYLDENNRLKESKLIKAQGYKVEKNFSLEFIAGAISGKENLAQVEVKEIDYSPIKDKNFKIKMYVGGTGSGKSYKAITESDNFVIITPTRQLAYEFFMDYPDKIDTIATGEIHETGENNAVMVYENMTSELLKKYDKLIIDEAHWINDEKRGTHLIELMIEAINQNKEVLLLTATDTLSQELKDIFHIEIQKLKPFKEVKKVQVQTEKEIKEMAKKGKIGIVFTKYVPESADVVYYAEKFDIPVEDIETLSADDPTSERLRKQIAFRKGEIKLLLATNVVAQGNNFPADYVVIEFNEYDTWELIEQKIGRAGRSQFTDVGYYYLNYRPPKNVPESAPKYKYESKVQFYRGIYIGSWEKKFEMHEVPEPNKLDSYRNIKYAKSF